MSDDFWRPGRPHCSPTRIGIGWIIAFMSGMLIGWGTTLAVLSG